MYVPGGTHMYCVACVGVCLYEVCSHSSYVPAICYWSAWNLRYYTYIPIPGPTYYM